MPSGRVGRLAVELEDEDRFTLAVRAVEALPPPAHPEPAVARLLVAASLSDDEARDVAFAVGRAGATVAAHPVGVAGLREALRGAHHATLAGSATLLVAVELAGPRGGRGELRWPTSAIALRLEPSSSKGALPLEALESGLPSDGSLADVIAILRRAAGSDASSPTSPREDPEALPWAVDDGEGAAIAEFTAEAIERRSDRPPLELSEGAYLPKPTYVEHRGGRWRLAADRCESCGALTLPRRGACRACGRTDRLVAVELPRRALVVEAVTTIHPGAQPTEFDDAVARSGAYSVLVARASPGVRITLQAGSEVRRPFAVGEPIDAVLRRIYSIEGDWRYGLKALPSPGVRSDR